MRIWVIGWITLLLAGCSVETGVPPAGRITPEVAQEKTENVLGNFGPAPELENEVWLNTETPLRLADLRGKVVLLDMWTFG